MTAFRSELVNSDKAIECFIQTTAITSISLRTLPSHIARALKLSRNDEKRIQNIVMQYITKISNSADEQITAVELLAGFPPLSTLDEDAILNMPEWEFRLRANEGTQRAIQEINKTVNRALRGERDG